MSIAVMRGKTSKGEGQLDTKQQDRQPLSNRQENPFANGAMTMPNGVKISKTHDAAPAGEGAYAVKANGSHLAQSAANHDTPQNKATQLRSRNQRRTAANSSNWQPATAAAADTASTTGAGGTAGNDSGATDVAAADGGIRGQLGNLCLLILLYLLQGVPMGLTMGALPFMLSSRMSYAQMGTFSLAAAPYSLKLLWSPIVDCLYSERMGRRKTWIVPIQFCTAFLLLACAQWISDLYEAADVNTLTMIFFVVVLLAATQDIAVDGWALTLLPPSHVAWAATCQTLGTSTGFFTSFTVFLALQDADFCNRYIRSWPLLQRHLGIAAESQIPLLDLVTYLRFWGVFFLVVTLLLWLLKPEGRTNTQTDTAAAEATATKEQGSLRGAFQRVSAAYTSLWGVLRLRPVWGMVGLLLTYRLGVLTAESAASVKLLEKGVAKETLAVLVLVQFPIELLFALLAGRWAARSSPSVPFLASYFLRLLANVATVGLVAAFPHGAGTLPLTSRPFLLLAAVSVFSSAVSSLAFTALGTVFNSISDPNMGGAYLTLLNTISNLGVTLPKTPSFYLMDALTTIQCHMPAALDDHTSDVTPVISDLACPTRPGDINAPSACSAGGGTCVLTRDGFYAVCWGSLVVGGLLGIVYLRWLPKLLSLPLSAWRCAPPAPSPSQAANAAKASPSQQGSRPQQAVKKRQ